MRFKNLARIACLGAALSIGAVPAIKAYAADAYTVMVHDKQFRRWTRMVQAADLVGYARGKNPYTIFAPVDASFANLDPDLLRAIGPDASSGRGADFSQMTFVIQSHVTLTKIPLSALAGKVTTLTSVNGKKIVVDGTKTPMEVTTIGSVGTVTGPPIVTDNAIIYPVLLSAAHFVAQ
jgi:uncharacterized surface protein with fasciclin (FAS1) repeats